MLSSFKRSLNFDEKTSRSKDLGKKRIRKDEEAVQRCYNEVKCWGNPFEKGKSLTGLSSQVEASKAIVDDLLNAEEIGTNRFKEFLKKRVESNEINFYAPIKKNMLRTFDKTSGPKIVKVKNKEVAIASDRETFARLLIIQQKRDVSLKEVMKYELSPTPLSLSDPDASTTLRKSSKSLLFNYLKSDIPVVNSVPDNTVPIFDGMVLFQKLPTDLTTFGDVSDYILNKIMDHQGRVSMFITDNYLDDSIKSLERRKRADLTGVIRMQASRRNQKRPKQFDKFLRLPQNKIDLINFLIKDWSTNEIHSEQLEGRELYVSVEDRAYKISSNQNQLKIVEEIHLCSQQEEADTKMFLAAKFAFELGFSSVVIKSIDTDVAILALYFASLLNGDLFLEVSTSEKKIYNASMNTVEESAVEALPGIHALSGCDSTSSFKGKSNLITFLKYFKYFKNQQIYKSLQF